MSSEVPETPPQRTPTLQQRLLAAPVSVVLFAICIAVFVVAESHGSTQTNETLLKYGATWRGLVWKGEGWRLFTSMFLHIGLTHLVWNLYAGFSWTSTFERVVGPVRFLVVYLASGLAGSALSVIGHDAVSAGASGALFGVIGGAIILHRRAEGSWPALWARPEQRRNLFMVAVWLAIGPFLHFDSFAHAGGLLAGAALTWTMVPMQWGTTSAALGAVALLSWISLHPIPGLHDEWINSEALRVAYEKEDWTEVVRKTETAFGKPDVRFAWPRAVALSMLNRAPEAEPLLSLVSGPPVPLAGLRAKVHVGVARYDEALRDVAEGLKAKPDDVELLRLQVWVLLQQGSASKAQRVLDRVASLSPGNLEASALQVRVHVATGHADQAFELVTDLRARAPQKYDAELVETLVVLGKYDEARVLLLGNMLEPQLREALSCYVEASAGQLESAEKVCASPGNPWLRELRVAVAAAKDDCAPLWQLLTSTPRSRFLQLVAASCLIKEKRWVEATESVETLLAVEPTDSDVLLLRLALIRSDEEYDEVLSRFEGHEAEATRGVVWQLLPANMREAFPRR